MKYKKFYQNEPKFNGFCSRNDLPIIKDMAYIINFDELESVETHWIALYVSGDNVAYFYSFGVEYISKEMKKLIGNKNIMINIYRIQANDSIMCGYFCIGFIDFMLKDKGLLNYTNLFSSYEYEKNDKTMLNHFQ